MSEKTLNSRMIQKHDIEANWLKATNFTPLQGELIVYDVDENYNYERIKMGDGVTNVNELPFISPQVDWNQNDENAPDYVKNRTHWEEGVILPETEFKKESGMTTQFEIETPLSAVPVEGKTYVVTVDGVTHESPAIRFEMEGIEMFVMGNASLFGLEGGVADVPYGVMLAPAGIPMDEGTTHTVYGSLNFPDEDFRDHATLSIVEKDAAVHKLDPKFIHTPDWNAKEGEPGYIKNRTHYVVSENVSCVMNQDFFLSFNGERFTVTTQGDDGNPATLDFCRISDKTPSQESFEKAHIVVTDSSGETIYNIENFELSNSIGEDYVYHITYRRGGYTSSFPIACFQTAGTKVGLFEDSSSVNVPAPGVYVPPTVSVAMVKDVVTIDFESETYKKLDPKFLPDTVVMAERPEIGGEVVILPETELTLASDETMIPTAPNTKPEVGSVCTVTYNGTAYDCPAVAFADDGMAGVAFGNTDALGLPGGNATAPFIVLLLDTPMDIDGSLAYGMLAPIGEITEGTIVTLSIVQTKEVIPQQLVMDKDGNIKWEDRTHWVEGGTIDILPEATYTDDASIEAGIATPLSHALVAGEVYQVNYNGTIYKCTCIGVTESGITIPVLGNTEMMNIPGGNPDAPFVFMEIPRGIPDVPENMYWQLLPTDESGEALPLTFGIKYEGEIIHKIDNKFLDIAPSNWNALPGTPGHIENRTHYCDHVVMTYDPTKLAGVDTLTADFGSGNPIIFYKIGDYALDAAALKASSYTITTLSTGEQSTTTVTMAQDNNGTSTGITPTFLIHSIHDLAAASESGVVAPSTGTYMIVLSEEVCVVTVDTGEIIKKLDEKYLPEKEEINSNLINGIAEGSLRAINTNAESDTYSLGDDSVALNTGTAASGVSSFSTGVNTKAAGKGSHAEGYATKATGDYSHSEGYSTVAKGKHSHSEGYSTQIAVKLTGAAYATQYKCNIARDWSPYIGGIIEYNGITAIVLNMVDVTTLALSTTLSSDGLTDTEVIIHTGVAFDEVAHSEGVGTLAFGIGSHAEGRNTQAIGRNSHAEGQYASAEADYSHAEGFSTKALGIYSHAEGRNTQTFGRSQLVIGEKNKFSTQVRYSDTTAPDSFEWSPATGGNLSNLFRKLSGIHTSINRLGVYVFDSMELVEDYTTLAIGDCFVTAGGKPEVIKRYYELVSPINYENGTFTAEIIEHTVSDNYLERGEYVFVIGNGDPTIANRRSNAHAVDWDGNAYFAGDVYVQGDGTTFEFDGKKKLATESYVDSKIPTPEDALALMIEMGFVDPVVDENGATYTDENNNFFTY